VFFFSLCPRHAVTRLFLSDRHKKQERTWSLTLLLKTSYFITSKNSFSLTENKQKLQGLVSKKVDKLTILCVLSGHFANHIFFRFNIRPLRIETSDRLPMTFEFVRITLQISQMDLNRTFDLLFQSRKCCS
jgi:hypothetical protein